VADSGVPLDDERFKPVYWTNRKEENGDEDEDNDHNGCYHDVIGCSFLTRGFPEDDVDLDAEFRHGTHVAGLASGRSLPDALRSVLDNRIRLMILKVANSSGQIDPTYIHDAINYAQNKMPRVVNMSFEGDTAGSTTMNLMKSNPQILFVVAAGNRKLNLDSEDNEVYPASLGATLDNVITVAASNEKRELACFSNYGTRTVMLAAPGVSMNSTVDVGEQFHSGTSQASPLVALTVALLDAKGMHDASDIKMRIFNTVSFVRGMQVQSEGILNINKAISFEVDLIELKKSGEVLKGEISPVLINLPGRAVPLESVESVVIDHSLTAATRDRVWRLRRGVFGPVDTDLGDLVITMKCRNGDTVELHRDQISSITPARK